jgi:hypothetical protein
MRACNDCVIEHYRFKSGLELIYRNKCNNCNAESIIKYGATFLKGSKAFQRLENLKNKNRITYVYYNNRSAETDFVYGKSRELKDHTMKHRGYYLGSNKLAHKVA